MSRPAKASSPSPARTDHRRTRARGTGTQQDALVSFGRSPRVPAVPSAWRAPMTPGTLIADLLIRAFIVSPCHIRRVCGVMSMTPGNERLGPMDQNEWLEDRFEEQRAHL